MGNMLARQRNRITRLRVAAQPRWAVVQREAAEAADLDTLTRRERRTHHFQQRLHREIDVVGLQVTLTARQYLDQFGLGHAVAWKGIISKSYCLEEQRM